MNQSLFLHIVEKLESFAGKLPDSIQKPVLRELTPLKEVFLQQRAPRLLLTGTSKLPLPDLFIAMAGALPEQERGLLTELFRWQQVTIGNHGTIALLDARAADHSAHEIIRSELAAMPADIVLYWEDADVSRPPRKQEVENLTALLSMTSEQTSRVLPLVSCAPDVPGGNGRKSHPDLTEAKERLQHALTAKPIVTEKILPVCEISLAPVTTEGGHRNREFTTRVREHLPNETHVEWIRACRDTEAQKQIAQSLVKSTSAICTAIGAQPIPLADLPVLTTLQLVMVAGIMQLAGRERSLRAATEFVAALGVNVGAGMLLREGARAVLKFFPGWGNVVCGMVAGAGTYGIGRAATAYFLEGVTLKTARQTYLTTRKKAARSRLPAGKTPAAP